MTLARKIDPPIEKTQAAHPEGYMTACHISMLLVSLPTKTVLRDGRAQLDKLHQLQQDGMDGGGHFPDSSLLIGAVSQQMVGCSKTAILLQDGTEPLEKFRKNLPEESSFCYFCCFHDF